MARAAKIITVNELAEELGTDPRKLRQFIRKLGFRAPKTDIEGFGPRAKYQWPENSPELKKIKAAWKQRVAEAEEVADEEIEENEDEEDAEDSSDE